MPTKSQESKMQNRHPDVLEFLLGLGTVHMGNVGLELSAPR